MIKKGLASLAHSDPIEQIKDLGKANPFRGSPMFRKFTSLRNMMVPVMLAIGPASFASLPSFAQNCVSCVGRNFLECQCPSTPSSRQIQSFGAIAYSVSTNNVGYSHGKSSAKVAERVAVSFCSREDKGADDCKLEAWFENRCGAIASGDDDIIRWGIDVNKSLAERAALLSCKSHGGKNCEAITAHCSVR
jgi:hypothetical protein